MSQIIADFFERRLLGAGRPVCLRFSVASLVSALKAQNIPAQGKPR
jgi:hypothetical protein